MADLTHRSTSFALVDCNNFYVSCERLFQPALENHPVIVLSNNDGCAIARSNEAKQLGIAMGAPFHKIERLIEAHDVKVFSSNFALYGDLSARVMSTLQSMAPKVEIYSIDEAFLDLSGMSAAMRAELCQALRQKIKRWTGIPVSIGIGPTKTLAKVANYHAKRAPRTHGVLDITRHTWRERALKKLQVGDVWGVGRRWAEKLQEQGIHTAWQLSRQPPPLVRKRFNVVLERTVRELDGQIAISMEEQPPARQSIATTRTFGEKIHSLAPMREAVSTFTARAAEKLRRHQLLAGALQIFITTNRFSERDQQYKNSITLTLPESSDDSFLLIETALEGLSRIYRPGFRYQKAGVILLALQPARPFQRNLFAPPVKHPQAQELMQVMDRLNQEMGRGTVRFGAEGLSQTGWKMRQLRKSPAYTTRWEELAQIG
uniref:DNA-directed DNA polymerase n=1 Tax=Magnetococcus massalia (strain MO-1) TaxID=451514 RepID=A0A1S7LGR3_MAGMO|nr:DNA-directed DNA polymerase [Candidatus Magnetococcus massalia]